MTKSTYIYGIHDPGGEHLMADAPGTIVFTVDVRNDTPIDFSAWNAKRYRAIVRLNWSHHGKGTIPPRSDDWINFAGWCADFVSGCRDISDFVVANEPNLSNESGRGKAFSPEEYVTCYKMVYKAIKARMPTAQVAPAAIGPWNIESGIDWITYFRQVLERSVGHTDWICLHTYSRGSDPASITSDDRMDAPYQKYHNGFRTYLDFLDVVPTPMRHLPVNITEANQDQPWANANTGWVQAAYAEIDRHNREAGAQKIHTLALFRWPKFDTQWQFETKPGVHEDFRKALQEGYSVSTSMDYNPLPQGRDHPLLSWDARLDRRGADYVPAAVQTGTTYWKLSSGRWLDENESQGKHHIFVEVLDEQGNRLPGVRVRFYWATGDDVKRTEAKPGENYAVDFPMHAAGWGYGLQVEDGVSDKVEGLGLGSIEQPEYGIHTSYRFVFQRTVKEGSGLPVVSPGPQPPIPPKGEPMSGWHAVVLSSSGLNIRSGPNTTSAIVAAAPEDAYLGLHTAIPDWLAVEYNGKNGYVASKYVMLTPEDEANGQPDVPSSITPPSDKKRATTTGDLFERSMEFVFRWEGGYVNDPQDIGGETNWGISKRSYPHLDIKNLTKEQAKDIYRRDYWQVSGADDLPWPLCLAHFDTAVNAGVGRAQEMLDKSDGDFLAYMGHLITWYTQIRNFEVYGRAWIRRRADILLEAAR